MPGTEKKQKNKRYKVFFDMKWSDDIYVTAPNSRVARAKAFAKFIKKLTQKWFTIYVETDDRNR